MAFPGSVILNFVARTADAVRDVDKLTRAVRDTGDEAKKTDSKAGKLSGTLKTGLAVGAGAAAAGIFALADFMLEAGKAALEDKQAADNLANTLKTIPGVTQKAIDANEDWILGMTLATNVADNDLRTAISKLTLATGDLEEAQKLTTVAVDVAAGSGKSLTSVTDALAKAHEGNTSALKRMFPWLDKNKDGTLTYAEAIDGLGDSYKGAADKAAKNDPWKRIQTIWGELKESLGGYLVPLIERFGEWFKKKDNQQKIQDFIDKMGRLSAIVGGKLVAYLEDFARWLKDPKNQKALKDWAEGMGNFASNIADVVGQVKGLIYWINKLPGNWILRKIGLIPDFEDPGRSSGGGNFRGAPTPPPILVTEDMVYQSVARLIMRGEARHGGRPIRLLA